MSADQFFRDVEGATRAKYRQGVQLREAPGPARLATHTMALTGQLGVGDQELCTCRIVALHEPEGHESWEGDTRIVAYLDAQVDDEQAGDPALLAVAWDWLEECLARAEVPYRALGGTVTRVESDCFGVMSDREFEGRVQIRASWTPTTTGLIDHVGAWVDLMFLACGIELTPDGVTSIARVTSR